VLILRHARTPVSIRLADPLFVHSPRSRPRLLQSRFGASQTLVSLLASLRQHTTVPEFGRRRGLGQLLDVGFDLFDEVTF
jgi:hypothetical protein